MRDAQASVRDPGGPDLDPPPNHWATSYGRLVSPKLREYTAFLSRRELGEAELRARSGASGLLRWEAEWRRQGPTMGSFGRRSTVGKAKGAGGRISSRKRNHFLLTNRRPPASWWFPAGEEPGQARPWPDLSRRLDRFSNKMHFGQQQYPFPRRNGPVRRSHARDGCAITLRFTRSRRVGRSSP
jgi:hypothetical protein